MAEPGDVVWLRGGVYPSALTITRSGKPGAPVVFESFPGECAVLDGAGVDGDARVQLWHVEHVEFRNLEVRNVSAEGIFLSGVRDSVIRNVRSSHNGGSGILALRSDRNVFAYLLLHDNVDEPDGEHADGISISSGNGNRIHHCLAYRNSDDGVDTWLSTWTLVERCVSVANGQRQGDGRGFKLGGAGRPAFTVVRESIAIANRFDGFDTNSGAHVMLEHNTSFGNGRYGFVAGAGAVLRHNLAIADHGAPWRALSGGADAFGNSWQLTLADPRNAVRSVDPVSEAFLSPRVVGAAAGAAPGAAIAERSPDLGAVPPGATIGSHLGVEPERLGAILASDPSRRR